jgi:radical SAM protein with 4Fe4S-binding SPASM domain
MKAIRSQKKQRGFSLQKELDPKRKVKVILPLIGAYMCGMRNFPAWSVEIQPSARCNLSCVYCSYGLRNVSHASLPWNYLSSFCESIGNLPTRVVYLSGGGEPLCYKWIRETIEILSQFPLRLALITNGILMLDKKPPISDLMNRFGYIQISLHSAADQVNQLPFDPEEKVLDIPTQLDRTGQRPEILGVRMVVNNRNWPEVFDKLAAARQSGFDYIVFTPERDFERRGLGMTTDNIHALQENIRARWEEADPDFCNLRSIAFNKDDRTTYIPTDLCWALELRLLAICDPEGDIYTCIPRIGDKRYSIGSIKESHFHQIWNSESHLSIIEKLNKEQAEGNCSNCRFFSINTKIQNLISRWRANGKVFL